MKTLIICLAFLVGTTVVSAQEITQLKEAKVGFSPMASEIKQNGNLFTFAVKESYKGEFEKDPIHFMNQNMDMENFLELVKDKKYENYQVKIVSTKGSLYADFDRNGKLLATNERFEDIAIPRALMAQILRDHKGWEMVKNIHITRGKNGQATKEIYKIKLENGKQSKRIKISVEDNNLVEVASN